MLALSLALYHDGTMALLPLLAALTCNPARLLGLPQGVLARGAPADLALIDLDRPWIIEPAALLSKSKNAPYEHLPVRGRVLRAAVDGKIVYPFAGAA